MAKLMFEAKNILILICVVLSLYSQIRMLQSSKE